MIALRARAAVAFVGLAAVFVSPRAATAHPPGDPAVARILYQEWRVRGASEKVLLAMFEAAFTESGMRNLTYGDRDSVGVFQMRLRYFSWAEATNVHLEARWFLRTAISRERYYGSAGSLAQGVERSAAGWKYNANQGYALAWIRYARGAAPMPPPSSGSFRARVAVSALNVRTGPGLGFRIAGLLHDGAVVSVSGTSGGWYKILYGGSYRWIAGWYTRRV